MWNKKTLLLTVTTVAALLGSTLEAQYYNPSSSGNRRRQSSSRQKKQQVKAQAKRPASAPMIQNSSDMSFDPRKPSLKVDTYNKVVTDIRKQLLEAKFTDKLGDSPKKYEFWTSNRCYRLVFYFRELANNPEAPEITNIHPDWFKQYAALLRNFDVLNRKVR